MKESTLRTKGIYLFLALVLAMSAAIFIDGAVQAAESPVYTRDAAATKEELADRPGVYTVTAKPGDRKEGDNPATIGISSIAKQNLADRPTTETPAIIMGAAIGYEKKTGPVDYDKLKDRVAPYSYFRYGIIDEEMQDADGNITVHKKLSGFDGSYYIIRVNLSELLSGIENLDGKYLHVKQEDNKALMVAVGFDRSTYSNGGNKTGSYPLGNDLAALKDTDGNDKDTPYFDVILLSSAKLVAGAEGTSTDPNVLKGDVKLSFYVDETEDYHPGLVALDPQNMPTFPYTCKPDGEQGEEVTYQTETDYNNALFTKYFEDSKAQDGEGLASYLVKGSDLEIDVTVDERDEQPDSQTPPEFWSLEKAMAYETYDSHVIKLICEVPVLTALEIKGENQRDVILDVNSFDIQIANNTDKNEAGLTINSGANLTIKDGTNTPGAELAIGNNASMVIKNGGVLVIDETCTNEVEYDAGTVPEGETPPDLAIGEITVEDGGKIINNGVINVEGAESKPKDPSQQDTPVVTDIKRADMFVNYGGVLENNGCLSLKGDLYVLGTLNNNGNYDDTIDAHDPDKGTTSYHRGIQVTWKDVVTDEGIEPGVLNVGIDADKKVEERAVLNNKGDIVLAPGTFNLYSTFNNDGNLYLCTADEAIIPVINPDDPLEVERRVPVNPPKESVFNKENGKVSGSGFIGYAKVALIHNGVLGELTKLYAVTFVDGQGNTLKIDKVEKGKGAAAPAAPKRDGYTFKGWDKDFSKIEADLTVAARWEKNSYNPTPTPTPTPTPAIKDGQTAVVSGNSYKVISASAGTIRFTKAGNKKSVTVPATVKIKGKSLAVTEIGTKAFTGKKIKTVTVGKNVKKIAPKAFKGSKATKLLIKTKKLTKKGVKKSLSGSKIKTIKIKAGKKSINKKYVKKYKKYFTKKNAGKKVTVK